MKWEYKIIDFSKRTFLTGKIDKVELERRFNEIGNKGWELVSMSNNMYGGWGGVHAVFKRQEN